MRKVSAFTDKVTARIATRGFERRAVLPSSLGRTALVLVRHGQTEKALLVSDNGVYSAAVWIPKSMVTIEAPSERGILVASMAKEFALQKGLSPYGRTIDPTLFNEATREVLAEAVSRAARKRNEYRGFRSGRARHDTQHQFC